MKNHTINIQGIEISIISQSQNDYISLTDMANSQMHEAVIIKWLSLKNTIEYIGEWEALYNPVFNYTEFGTIKNSAGSNNFVLSAKQWIEHTKVYADEADLLNVAMFGKTAKQWRDESPNRKGNMRDSATLEQLVVLSNLESINAMLIKQGIAQVERLVKLNEMAISQMTSLLNNNALKKLK